MINIFITFLFLVSPTIPELAPGTVETRGLTNAAGLRGDIEMGFHELEKAAVSDNIIKYDAQMMLMYLHEKEENYSEALTYAKILSERF